ncbi:MAG: hypothetical protein ACRCT1_07065 [Microcoleaceae cyanobacterium]|jgi:hypothetical protein
MNKKRLNIRISENRLNKLRLYAVAKEKTMTQIVEEWIDLIPVSEIEKILKTMEKPS